MSLSHDIVFFFPWFPWISFFFILRRVPDKERSFVCMSRSFIQLFLTVLRVRSNYVCLISFSLSYKLRTSYSLGVNNSFPTIPKRVATATVFFFLEDPNQNGSTIPPFLSVRDVDVYDLILEKRKRISLDEISWFIKRFVRYSVSNLPRIERQWLCFHKVV